MILRYCDCNHLLQTVVTTVNYHMCSKCGKRFPFEKGDTLIRAPATKPVGAEKYDHLIQHIHEIRLMPTIDKECPQCKKRMIKYAILDSMTWYRCMASDCEHLFQ
jgi:hypothetical protein